MRGLYEWIAFTGGMVLAGVARLTLFFNPLLLVLILLAVGACVAASRFMNWMSTPESGGR